MLEADIRQAIEKHLSAEVGTLLKERLAKADKDSKDLASANGGARLLYEECEELKAELKTHRALSEREAVITKREAEVLAREVRHEVLQEKLNGANAVTKAVYDLTALAFRNPRIMRHETETRAVQIPALPGCYPSSQSLTDTKSVIEQAE